MKWLLRLYPREWRRRYGAEIEEIVGAQPSSIQLGVDLLGGAIDAHLRPQAFARRLDERTATTREGEPDMIDRLKGRDAFQNLTTRDGVNMAALTLGAGLAVAAIVIVLDALAPVSPGNRPLAETVMLTMMPALLIVPFQWIFLRGHSRLARTVMLGGPFAACLAIGLVAGIAVMD